MSAARTTSADEAGAKTRLAAPPTPKGEQAAVLDVTLPQIEEVVARMARIPAKQASSSDKDRLRTLEESLARVVFGQEEAVKLVARAIKRSRAGLGQPDRPVLFLTSAVWYFCASNCETWLKPTPRPYIDSQS